MEPHALNHIIKILETAPDFFVPVKKLWLTLKGKGLVQDIELEDFYRILLEDERFEFIQDVEPVEGFEGDAQLAQEMEALGFYTGPRVKLISRKMTAQDVFNAMGRSLKQMNESLQGAWDTRPEGDQELDDQLLDILAAGQKLEREIHELTEQEEE